MLHCIFLNHYRGAEVDQEGPNQRTALHEAAHSGHVRVAEILVNNGADPVARDDGDSTPYDLAFQNGHKEVMHIPFCAFLVLSGCLQNMLVFLYRLVLPWPSAFIPNHSGTPLLWTPWALGEVPCIERCPYFWSKFQLRKRA